MPPDGDHSGQVPAPQRVTAHAQEPCGLLGRHALVQFHHADHSRTNAPSLPAKLPVALQRTQAGSCGRRQYCRGDVSSFIPVSSSSVGTRNGHGGQHVPLVSSLANSTARSFSPWLIASGSVHGIRRDATGFRPSPAIVAQTLAVLQSRATSGFAVPCPAGGVA